MGNSAGKTAVKRMASSTGQTPLKVTNKHFVLGSPIQGPFPDGMEKVVVGTGCFWGTEKGFWNIKGGKIDHPTYRQVCSGVTGHNETVLVVWDPKKVSFSDILRQFWQSHDPTQGMGQGNDRGTQYRSGIYCYTKEQAEAAKASAIAYDAELKKAKKGMGPERDSTKYHPITTEIIYPAPTFYYAEDYHQQYLDKPGSRQYCSAQPQGVSLPASNLWLPDVLKKIYEDKVGGTGKKCTSG